MTVKAQITISNVNDGIITGPQPTTPTIGALWLDSSVTPNPMLKEWDGTQWQDKGELDPTLSSSIDSLNTSISNMTDDSLLDFKERQGIKQDISNIIGTVISDQATTLPTNSSLDTGGQGSFYSVRRAALNAGISAEDANYTALTNAYNTLKSYLEGMVPLPWDAGLPNRASTITITPTTYRTNWLNYYIAENVLRSETAQQLKDNVTNLEIGARNYMMNTSQFTDTSYWSLNKGSAITGTIGLANDTTYGSVIDVDVTVNSYTNNWIVIQNNGLLLPNTKFTIGNTYTLSFLMKNDLIMYVGFMDPDGTHPVSPNSADIPVSTNWRKVTYTFTATATGNTPEFYLAAHDTTDTGHIMVTQVQLEDGQKATGYNPAPEDTAGQISDLDTRMTTTESVIQPDNITNTVLSSDSYSQQMSGKANTTDLGKYATTDALDAASSAANTYTDGQIKKIDFAPYVKSTTLTDTVDGINANIRAGGGINLVKNSVGFAQTDMWAVTGTVKTIQNDELTALGYLSGFTDSVGVQGYMTQTIYTMVGQWYTLSFYMRKDTDGTADAELGIYVIDADGNQVKFEGIDTNMGTQTDYKQYIFSWQATTATYTLKPYFGANTTGVITGIMANIGPNALQWSMATGELYNTNIQMDLNGISVTQQLNGITTGKTVMTPEKFAGYYDVNGDGVIDISTGSADEVFRMDKDEFVMKKANISNEITLSNLKIIMVSSGSINGIAFVKNT